MSDLAIGRAGGSERGAFRLGAVIALLAVGIIGFIALTVGSAYRQDNGISNWVSGHALSDSAVGYSGVIRLGRAIGREVRIVRDKSEMTGEKLLVMTPPFGSTPIGDMLQTRTDLPTLVILPKWMTGRRADHPGWVTRYGLDDASDAEQVFAPNNKFKVVRTRSGGKPLLSAGWMTEDFALAAPRPLQTISGANLTALLTDQEGRIVLAQIGDKPLYVLADPDLLDNIGMRDEHQAGAALALLQALNSDGQSGFDFDVSLLGIGKPKNLLRLAFEPPFLAMTLALGLALLLVGWQAFARFGPTVHRARAIAFGKAALVDNAAALVRKAGKQARLGGRYVDAIRDRAVIAFGVPARLRGDAIDRYLDKISGRARFTELAQAVDDAEDKAELVAAARRLHDWQKEKGT